MKSKTFVMMFVAIGCGLVAAYLTARITPSRRCPIQFRCWWPRKDPGR